MCMPNVYWDQEKGHHVYKGPKRPPEPEAKEEPVAVVALKAIRSMVDGRQGDVMRHIAAVADEALKAVG